jgi:hypothetical protein
MRGSQLFAHSVRFGAIALAQLWIKGKSKSESRRMNMRKSKKEDFLFYVAGGLLILAFVLVWFVSSPSALEMLHYVGWVI